ncbi:MAG: type II secretion system protein [Phycisphaerae bacterium]
MKKKGFTLVELLVVIAIIALLVSILLPSLGRAKELANQLKCMANLSGIGKAGLVYMADNDDKYPMLASANTSANGDSNFFFPTGKNYGARRDASNNALDHSITALMFLILRSTQSDPGLFVCPSTDDTKDTEPKDPNTGAYAFDFHFRTAKTGTWGDDTKNISLLAVKGVSYSHQMATRGTVLTSQRPRQVWMADKSPNWDGSQKAALEANAFPASGTEASDVVIKLWNSPNHNGELNNTLLADGSTSKNKRADVGTLAGGGKGDDNIYSTYGNTGPANCRTAVTTGDLKCTTWGASWQEPDDAFLIGPFKQ